MKIKSTPNDIVNVREMKEGEFAIITNHVNNAMYKGLIVSRNYNYLFALGTEETLWTDFFDNKIPDDFQVKICRPALFWKFK